MNSTDPDSYRAIVDGPEVELRVRGSRFLGHAVRTDSEAMAGARLETLRREHHAATHHCWAYRVGRPGAVLERFDDDGEPSGTAGRPILVQLQAGDVHDAMLVVTRYFGGTKLGPGGLSRAYSDTAAKALEAAPRRIVRREARLVVTCVFDDVGPVEAVLARAGADVYGVDREYAPQPRMIVAVRRSRGSALAEAIADATGGRAGVRRVKAED